MDLFWLAFIPLFVAFDGVGLLPLYWALSHRLTASQRRRAVTEAVMTAAIVAVAFLLVSRFVFSLMGLTVSDVMIAGGLILIVLCLRELLLPEKPAIGIGADEPRQVVAEAPQPEDIDREGLHRDALARRPHRRDDEQRSQDEEDQVLPGA